MSALDADLYSDLYSNDEPDVAQEDQQDNATTTVSTSAPVTTDDSTTPAAQSSHTESTAPLASIPTYTSSDNIAPNSAYSGAQQIPTYEQPPASDYSAAYSGGVAGSERTVRPSEMKDEGKMFIGGLNWDTTDESLRAYFTQFGKVDACTIMRDAAGRSRCFAFLTFEEPSSVNAVMVREHFLDGKIIDPKRAIPRQEHQRATKLFIGGLAGSVTSESMREFFSQYGKVIDSTVMLDRETGRSKGFGFISFEDTNVQPFLGFGNLEIDGKLIDVKLAQPRYQRDNYNEGDIPEEYARMPGAGPGNAAGGFPAAAAGGFSAQPGAGGAAPFDPQALAALYTRMFQMAGAGGMNPMMQQHGGMGMMNPGMMRGGMPMQGGGRGGPNAMMNNPMNNNPNIPRGPRGAPTPPTGPAGVGPQRAGPRGQHNYHPYAR